MRNELRNKAVVLGVLILSLFWAPAVTAQMPDETIPPALRPWVPWVLGELGEEACTSLEGTRTCVWPGQLSLDLSESGGEFSQRVFIEATALHVLPGQQGAWPQDVSINGTKAPVLSKDGHPVVELSRGDHEIKGVFAWSRVPETLHVGAHTAFLSLSIAGKDVPLVKREGENIWLKGLATEHELSDEPEQVEIQVFRQIRDGIPLQVSTVLVFQVSGKSREISLPSPLLAGTLPLSVQGDLAVALEPSGALRVQLVPGRHEVKIHARATGMPKSLKSQKRSEPWPGQEVWTWHPNTELRAVEVEGAPGIDASRTNLPQDWRADGAYAVGPEDGLTLTTTRRAQEQVPSNRIQLNREFWLDEAAGHFTVRDTLSGQMHQGWRLDLLSGELGQVNVGSDSQVITLSPARDRESRGVEVRDANLSMVAVSRVPKTSKLSAVGWSEDVDSLTAHLRLPPGWELFAATGVDDTTDTWISRWDLFSVFYVLLMTLAVARLVSLSAGIVTAVALILAHGESGSPEYIWLPLVVFAALAVLIEKGRYQKLLRVGFYSTALLLLLVLVSFAVTQVRSALYPHLELNFAEGGDFGGLVEGAVFDQAQEPAPAAAPLPTEEAVQAAPLDDDSKRQDLQKSVAQSMVSAKGGPLGGTEARSRGYDSISQKQFKPDSIVQTGPGIPDVSGRSWTLTWSGPVVKEHEIQLYLISPAVQRVLTGLRLLLLGALGWLIWRRVHAQAGKPKVGAPNIVAAAMVAILALQFVPETAHADEPSDARLAQLKERLAKPAACQPSCVSASTVRVEVGAELVIRAQVHAGDRAAYKLPGPATALSSIRVTVDGKPVTAVRLESDGAYYLRLEKGVHQVELRAQLASDRTTLELGLDPERVSVVADGWTVSGVNELGRVEGGTLTLQRDVELSPSTERPGESDEAKIQATVPPFFTIRRSISLGITGHVVTEIQRISDATSPEVLRLPLLPGERLTTPGVDVKDGVVVVPFPREAQSKRLESTLVIPDAGASLALILTAPDQSPMSEVWEIDCGVVWHCQTKGIAATSHVEEGRSLWRFHPWPGETLELSANQPQAAPGSSLTVQKATLTLTPGIRMARGELQMAIQTSRSAVHTVTIPAQAKLEGVEVDGVAQAVKSENGHVRISLSPGMRQVSVKWQEASGITTVFRSPQISTGAAGVNFRTVVDLPEKRWLIMAGGPMQGPAILLWGYLVLILVAAVLLPRLPYSPLKSWQWVLLGLGLTQVPSVVALMVAGWFFAIGARNRIKGHGAHTHNFIQLCLIGYTLTFLVTLTFAVYEGLVSSPDMEVTGAGSYGSHLVWVSDRSPGAFAPVWALSLSIWVWRIFMLAWALWLSRSLLTWLKWAWNEMSEGYFWAPKAPAKQRITVPAPPPTPGPAAAVPEGPARSVPVDVAESGPQPTADDSEPGQTKDE